MADHKQDTLGISAYEQFGSNPDMYLAEKGNVRNLTNPREIYNILSCRTKSAEDFSIRLKQELVKSIQTPGVLPKLTRTASMLDMRHNPNKSDRLGNKPSYDLNADKKFRVVILTRSKTGGEELTGIPEEGAVGAVNLPNISRNAISQGNIGLGGLREDHLCNNLELPNLKNGGTISKSADVGSKRKADCQKNRLVSVKEEQNGSDSKLDKWFSEMPNEVFDKAQRALMEESIKDKLQTYQHKRSKKNHPPNQSLQLLSGTKSKRAQTSHMESAHVDSFGRGKPNQPDTSEKMSKYKLQQKSIHKLKMRELSDLERPDRSQQEVDLVPRLQIQQRAVTTLALTKPKTAQQPPVTKSKPEPVVTIPTDRGLKTVNINDRSELETAQKCKNKAHIASYDDYMERVHVVKVESCEEHTHAGQPHIEESKGNTFEHSEYTGTIDTAKAKIVTISLEKDIPVKRNPQHIQKTLDEQVCNEHMPIENDATPETEISGVTENELDDAFKQNENSEEALTRRDKIITKIPTARSSRTSDSKSTTSSLHSLANKSVLKRFNKLEVFAEHGSKSAEATMMRRNYHSRKVRDFDYKEVIPPSVRLDLKQYPNETRGHLKDDVEIAPLETKRQEVMFRFEPGEVFITTRKPNQSLTQSRASERARIIYGKVHGKDDKFRDRMGYMTTREATKDSISHKSFNSKIAEQFKTEIGQFESRALNGSISAASNFLNEDNKRNPSTLTDNVRVNGHSIVTRDVALETDIIGSEKEAVVPRNNSNMTDLDIDNNDGGDSLDTDTDNEISAKYANGKTEPPNYSV